MVTLLFHEPLEPHRGFTLTRAGRTAPVIPRIQRRRRSADTSWRASPIGSSLPLICTGRWGARAALTATTWADRQTRPRGQKFQISPNSSSPEIGFYHGMRSIRKHLHFPWNLPAARTQGRERGWKFQPQPSSASLEVGPSSLSLLSSCLRGGNENRHCL